MLYVGTPRFFKCLLTQFPIHSFMLPDAVAMREYTTSQLCLRDLPRLRNAGVQTPPGFVMFVLLIHGQLS